MWLRLLEHGASLTQTSTYGSTIAHAFSIVATAA
jgi:hypothetical protein